VAVGGGGVAVGVAVGGAGVLVNVGSLVGVGSGEAPVEHAMAAKGAFKASASTARRGTREGMGLL
jgi:hypothetical protein